MKFKEEVRDILDVPRKYFICHASSADLDMTQGLAKVINNSYGLVNGLEKKFSSFCVGEDYIVGNVITLIVKENSLDKVDIDDVRESIQSLACECEDEGIQYIAFPKICCGNMGMKWADVKSIIKEEFKDTDVEILICHESESDIIPDADDMAELIKEHYSSLTDNARVALFESTREFLEKNIYKGIDNVGGF